MIMHHFIPDHWTTECATDGLLLVGASAGTGAPEKFPESGFELMGLSASSSQHHCATSLAVNGAPTKAARRRFQTEAFNIVDVCDFGDNETAPASDIVDANGSVVELTNAAAAGKGARAKFPESFGEKKLRRRCVRVMLEACIGTGADDDGGTARDTSECGLREPRNFAFQSTAAMPTALGGELMVRS
jgi:hypothetical protein